MLKAKLVLEYDATPNEDTWWEAWRKYEKAKKELERSIYELDEQGMEEMKKEIRKAFDNEEYEISLGTINEIVQRYQERMKEK